MSGMGAFFSAKSGLAPQSKAIQSANKNQIEKRINIPRIISFISFEINSDLKMTGGQLLDHQYPDLFQQK